MEIQELNQKIRVIEDEINVIKAERSCLLDKENKLFAEKTALLTKVREQTGR